jgi:acetolactate synthase-1/2/3 large subunit
VYLTAAREVLMSAVDDGTTADPSRLTPAAESAADPAAVQLAAAVLATAERPVIVTSRLGRDPNAVAELTQVAELIAAPVLDRRERLNLPTTHPCYVGGQQRAGALLRAADAVLVVDSDVPWVPSRAEPPADSTVILVDDDPVRASMPGRRLAADICLRATPRLALRQLYEQLTSTAHLHAQRWASRQESLHAAGRAPEQQPVRDPDEVLSTAAVAEALTGVLDDGDIVVEETVTGSDLLRQHLRRTRPGTLFQSGGSGLGWGLPASMGVKLARPDRRVVAVVGDGAFLFGAPAAALMSSAQADAPVLVVILQNGGYAASSRPVLELFPDGASCETGDVVGTRFTVMPDLAMLAWACHAYGEHAYRAGEIAAVLRRGLEALAMGRSAVVVAHVSSPWLPATTAAPYTPSPGPR